MSAFIPIGRRKISFPTSIKTRLAELGYHERDIEHPRVRRHKIVNTRSRLTEQAWVKMLPTLQPILVDLERTRRTQTRYMRIYTFDCYYRSLLRDLIPMQSLYMPNPQSAQAFALIQGIIEHDLDDTNYSGLFASITHDLFDHMSQWMQMKKQPLLLMLPDHLQYDNGSILPLRLRDTELHVAHQYASSATNSGLDDARAVFVQGDGASGAFIGCEVAQAWKADLSMPLVFSRDGCVAVEAIIDVLNSGNNNIRDAEYHISASELDRLDGLYVVCDHCRRLDHLKGNEHTFGYCWRASVSSFL